MKGDPSLFVLLPPALVVHRELALLLLAHCTEAGTADWERVMPGWVCVGSCQTGEAVQGTSFADV